VRAVMVIVIHNPSPFSPSSSNRAEQYSRQHLSFKEDITGDEVTAALLDGNPRDQWEWVAQNWLFKS